MEQLHLGCHGCLEIIACQVTEDNNTLVSYQCNVCKEVIQVIEEKQDE